MVKVGQQFKAATWALSVQLSEPVAARSVRSGHKLIVRGQVNFRARGTAAYLHGGSVRAALSQACIQIVPFVLSGAAGWWPQGKPVLEDDGQFAGEVYVGDPAGRSHDKDFVVVVCAVAQGAVIWNKPAAELPAARIESSRITVTRA